MLSLALLASALLTSPAFAATASDWQHRSIYQLVTDRFALSDSSSPSCNTGDRKYCGGSWTGIMSHLDYIQSMGFDAIWISPVVSNFEGGSAEGDAYHGYWPNDITSLNKHFGASSDLKALSDALHSRGMYLMLDVVVNHLATTSTKPDFTNAFTPFRDSSFFHPYCEVTDYTNQTNVESCWLGDSSVALVDLNTENDDVISAMHNMVQQLVSNFSVDGIRFDTVKHVPQKLWPDFAKAAGVFTIGEVLSNDTTYMAPYTKVLDAVLDYSTWTPLVAGFQTPSGNLSALVGHVNTLQSTFTNGARMTGSFLDNHDQPRFASLANDSVLIRNAAVWPFVYDGIPIMYYGQEQAYQGGADPANREALWPTGYQTAGKPMAAQTTALNLARKAAIAANSSFLSTPVVFPAPQTSAIALAKPPMLAFLTNVGVNATFQPTWAVNSSVSGYAPNERVVDVIGCNPVSIDAQGTLTVTAYNGAPMVFLPVSVLTKGGALCPEQATGMGNATSSTVLGISPSSTAPTPSATEVKHSGARRAVELGAAVIGGFIVAIAGAFVA